MSASASGSASASPSPSPTESDRPRPSESGIHIPTSTVVAIGGGFVCFALCVLGCLLLVRLFRLFLKSRREHTPFREAWIAQGGFFGWVHGVGARDQDELERRRQRENDGYLAWIPSSGLGGGGWYASEVARMRMWNDMNLRRARAGQAGEKDYWEGEVPAMWEVDVDSGLEHGKGELEHLADYEPIAVLPANMPEKQSTIPSTPARIRLSLLIALPSPEMHHKRMSIDTDEDGDAGDLPEMVIGSTVLCPTVRAPASGNTARHRPSGATATAKGFKKGEMEVSHIEDRDTNTEVRDAKWTRRGERWVVEGLEGDDEGSAKGEKAA